MLVTAICQHVLKTLEGGGSSLFLINNNKKAKLALIATAFSPFSTVLWSARKNLELFCVLCSS